MSAPERPGLGGSLEIRINPELMSRLRRSKNQRPADRAYEGIREAILTGVLRSGDHLREEPDQPQHAVRRGGVE